MRYLLIFLLGIALTLVYVFDRKIDMINAAIVAAYANTSFGHQTLRLTIHDSCYFGSQHIALTYVHMNAKQEFDYDQWCWTEADKDIKRLQEGLLPR